MAESSDEAALVPARERRNEQAVSRLSTISEFLGTLIDSLKGLNVTEQIGEAATWAGAIGDALQDAIPPLKGLATLLKRLTQKNDPEEVGFIACSRAFESAIAHALARVGPPTEPKAWTEAMRSGLDALVPSAELRFSDFSFDAVDTHPFVCEALKLLDGFAELIGYSESDRRVIQTHAARRFSAALKSILSDRKTEEQFRPFAERIALGADQQTSALRLDEHAEFLRSQFRDRQVLDYEPFALSDVYVEPQCSEFTWGTLRHQHLDPFDERSVERSEILERVIEKLGDPTFEDAIVVQGVAGAGKSAFTLRLCMRLLDEGLQPVRIRLRDLNLDRHVREALPAALRLPLSDRIEGRTAPATTGDLFRQGRIFERGVQFGKATIAPVVLILDGWDELSVTATVPFKERLELFLEQLRAEYLGEGRHPLVRVILTGRPSLAFSESRFLRDTTVILTLLPFLPDRVDRFLRAVAAALRARRLASDSWDAWLLAESQVDELSTRYAARFVALMARGRHPAPSDVLDVLGLPLLAFITVRLVAEWPDGLADLLRNPTVLMRSLVDLTCLKSGQVSTDTMDLTGRARVSGVQLRQLLRRTAVAISVRGHEAITFDELSRRIERVDLDLDAEAAAATTRHPLAELLVSYFFKGGRKELGCEFVHKSFREYLFAEEIVEQLKLFGRNATAQSSPRQQFWKDFDADDPRSAFSRSIASLTGPRWLAPEVTAHVLRLIDWELNRATDRQLSRGIQAIATEPLEIDGWSKVRDGLADLWDWWGEGVHLRSQAQRIGSANKIELAPPFAQQIVEDYIDVPPTPTAVVSPRLAAIDAQLGDALFRLAAYVHFRIARQDGWGSLEAPALTTSDSGTETWELRTSPPQEVWWRDPDRGFASDHPCQTRAASSHLLFRPAGRRPEYFANFASRINGGGNRPEGPFPGGIDASGADLRHVTLVSHGDTSVPAKWELANVSHVSLFGYFNGHDFSRVVAANLRAISAELKGASFVDALIRNSGFDGALLDNALFNRTTIVNTSFSRGSLDCAEFHSAEVVNLDVERTSMRALDARAAVLRGVRFVNVDLSSATFESASLTDVRFVRADLSKADLRGVFDRVDIELSNTEEAKLPPSPEAG